MRKLQFMKIDILRAGGNKWLFLLFPLLAGFILLYEKEAQPLFAVLYSMFGAIIFSSTPFCLERRSNCGFLGMLPAKNGEQIAGHYLFSLLLTIYDLTAALLVITVSRIFRPISFPDTTLFLLIVGFVLLVIGIQNMVLSLVPAESSTNMLTLIRMVPGFAFYYCALSLANAVKKNPSFFSDIMKLITLPNCIIFFAVSLLLFFVLMEVSCRAAARRDAA
ncbi:MAG: ABC-2 transporter permease [Lachnospiraceae bacterium]|nr:ABC-2 transporter permease [Lachnospiraceae bacterium]